MFNLMDYGTLISVQSYFIDYETNESISMRYKNNENGIKISLDNFGKDLYSGNITINDDTQNFNMRSLDQPLQRMIMKHRNYSNTDIVFYRYDSVDDECRDPYSFNLPLIESEDGKHDFLLAISKYHSVGIDKNKYAIIYNTKNRIHEKYYVLNGNNICYFSYDNMERPIEFNFYNSKTYKLTSISLDPNTPYYMLSPRWYTISEDIMRTKSEKFDVMGFPGKTEIISFGALGFDPFDLNNNDPDQLLWFNDKLDCSSEDSKVLQRNIFRIDKDKEEALYKKMEDFYIIKS